MEDNSSKINPNSVLTNVHILLPSFIFHKTFHKSVEKMSIYMMCLNEKPMLTELYLNAQPAILLNKEWFRDGFMKGSRYNALYKVYFLLFYFFKSPF